MKGEVANSVNLLLLGKLYNQRTDSYMATIDCKRQLPSFDGMATSDGAPILGILYTFLLSA